MHGKAASRDAQRASSAAAEERSDEGTGKRRLPAVGCNSGLGGVMRGRNAKKREC